MFRSYCTFNNQFRTSPNIKRQEHKIVVRYPSKLVLKPRKKWLTFCPNFGKLITEENHLHISTMKPLKEYQNILSQTFHKNWIDYVHMSLTLWPWVCHVMSSGIIAIQAWSVPPSRRDTQGGHFVTSNIC